MSAPTRKSSSRADPDEFGLVYTRLSVSSFWITRMSHLAWVFSPRVTVLVCGPLPGPELKVTE